MVKDDLASQILNIAKITGKWYPEVEHIGILAGQSGIALFQFHCAQYFDDNFFFEKGVEIVSSCVDKINSGYSHPSYSSGIAGFGWTLQHLMDHELIEIPIDDILTPFDEYLNAQMKLSISNKTYDFLEGALGYGFYFLKRMERTKNPVLRSQYSEYVKELVSELDLMAITEGDSKKWESILNPEKGNKGYNLSLSHGISSIICFLSKAHTNKISSKVASTLLNGAVNFLKDFEDTGRSNISLFPSWIEQNKTLEYNSRLAWCYGDIGIGLAIRSAGASLNDLRMQEYARDVLKHAAERYKLNNSGVVDSGICHGSFGNSHIFHLLSFYEDDPSFKNAAEFWLKDGLSRYTENPKEPYQHLNGEKNTWEMRLNLLEGLSGIGLCMLEHLSQKLNFWDESLMLH